jgi:hypothetical protein
MDSRSLLQLGIIGPNKDESALMRVKFLYNAVEGRLGIHNYNNQKSVKILVTHLTQ